MSKSIMIVYFMLLVSLINISLITPSEKISNLEILEITKDNESIYQDQQKYVFVNYQVLYNEDLIKEKSSMVYATLHIKPKNLESKITAFASFTSENTTRSSCEFISSFEIDNTSTIYIPMEGLSKQEEHYYYLGVSCDSPCIFDTKFSFSNSIEMTPNKAYTIKTSKDYTKFKASMPVAYTLGSIINYACIGGNEGDIKLSAQLVKSSSTSDLPHFDNILFNGDIGITKAQEDLTGSINMECEGQANSVITFSVRLQSEAGTIIIPDSPAYYGYLDGEIATKECFTIGDLDQPEEARNYSVTIVTKTNNLVYYIQSTKRNEDKKKVYTQATFMFRDKDSGSAICLEMENNGTKTAYSIQVNHYTKTYDKTYPYMEPQVNGIVYTQYLAPYQMKYYRHYKHKTLGINETNFNVREELGFISVYVVHCTRFPTCYYTQIDLELGIDSTKAKNLNGFHTLGIKGQSEGSLVDETQDLLFVVCNHPTRCIYTVSFFDESDELILPPKYEIVQVMNQKQKDKYGFSVVESSYKKMFVKLHTFTGDSNMHVTKEGKELSKDDYTQYWVGNAEILEIIPKSGDLLGHYEIVIDAEQGNFYSLYYHLTVDQEMVQYRLLGGYTYIETVKEGDYQYYAIKDRYFKNYGGFMVNIIPINCNIRVFYNDEEVLTSDTYFQHYPKTNQHHYNSDGESKENEEEEITEKYYTYRIAFDSWKQETYKDQLCTYYVASTSTYEGAELVVNEGISFEFKMDKVVRNIRFLYPRPPDGKDVFADIKIEHKTNMNMSIYVEDRKWFQTQDWNFATDRTFFVPSKSIDVEDEPWCKKDQLCSLTFVISPEKIEEITKEVNIFFTVKSRAKVPSLVMKRKQIEGIIPNSGTNYYNFDVMKGEKGEVSLNFNRGSGFLLARLVTKDETDPDYDWNGKIRLPKREDLDDPEKKAKLLGTYDSFTKTLSYNNSHTDKCENGCEMYVAVISDEEYQQEEERKEDTFINDYLFFIRTFNSDPSIPSYVDVPTGDFVYGALEYDLNDITHPDYYDYYTVTLMNDGDFLFVELQSEYSELNFTMEEETPFGVSSFMVKNEGLNKIEKFTKADFSSSSEFTFEGKTLKIAIGAQRLSEIYTAPYKFRVYVPHKYSDEQTQVPVIINVPTDQSELCKIENPDSPCYFIIPKYNTDFVNNIVMYVSSQTITQFTIYTTVENMRSWDFYTPQEIKMKLPNKNNYLETSEGEIDPSTLKLNLKDFADYDVYILVTVIAKKECTINFMTSFRSGYSKVSINPSTWQVFYLNVASKLTLQLPNQHNFIAHLISINGLATVSFAGRKQAVYGSKNSFSVAVKENSTISVNRNLEISTEVTDFMCYVWISVRSNYENFDQAEYGISGQYFYSASDFPLMFYTKMNVVDNSVIMNFNIRTATKESQKGNSGEGLILEAAIDTVDNIYLRKNNKDHKLADFKIIGDFDDISNSGRILIDYDNLKDVTNPYVIVRISKSKYNKFKYSKLHLDVLFTPLSDPVYAIPVDLYYNSLIPNKMKEVRYRLAKKNFRTGIMLFEFSSNTDLVDYVILEQLPVSDNNNNNNSIGKEYKNCSRIQIFTDTSGKGITKFLVGDLNEMFVIVFSRNGTEVEDQQKTGFTLKYRSEIQLVLTDFTPQGNLIKSNNKSPLRLTVQSLKNGRIPVPARYYTAVINKNELTDKGYFVNSIALKNLTLDFPVVESFVTTEDLEFYVKLDFYKNKGYYRIYILAVIEETGERVVYPLHTATIKSTAGKTVGIVFGVLIAIGLVGAGGYYFYFHIYKKKMDENQMKKIVEETSFVQTPRFDEDYLTGGYSCMDEVGLNTDY